MTRFDTSVAVLLLKIGHYPLHPGGVGAARSLGRAGVPVYAITEDPNTPLARSRYLTNRFVAHTSPHQEPEAVLDVLDRIAPHVPDQTIVVPTDDEGAVILAEHRDALDARYMTPAISRDLPRRLASKRGLYEECMRLGVPAPRSVSCSSPDDLEAIADTLEMPVVVKNVEPWVRARTPVVRGTTVITSRAELLALHDAWPPGASLLVQEYIPMQVGTDWILHAYCDIDAQPLVAFTGVKYRSWPPQTGITTYGRLTTNEPLLETGARFFRALGYRGILDLDWRFDVRDGQYKLVDFNPRIGGQFRLFENEAGIDVIRAMHLDLTGREVPRARPKEARGYVAIQLDIPARVHYRRHGLTVPPHPQRRVEQAWFARDDVMPFAMMLVRAPAMLTGRLQARYRRCRDAMDSATRGAAKWVPWTNRSSGPNVSAAGKPVK